MDYGIGDPNYVLSPEPLYAEKTDEGIIIKYKNVGDGLKRLGQHDMLSGFRVIVDNKYKEVDANIISKDTVLLDTNGISDITGVAYGIEQLAFVDYPEGNGDLKYVANLGNSENLPSPTFKIKISVNEEVPPTPVVEDIIEDTKEDTNDEENSGKNNTIIWVSVCVGIVILAAIIIFFIKRK